MAVNYTRVGWQDAPSTETPIDAANLNHMDNGILALSEEVDTELPLLQEQINDISEDIDTQIDEKIPPEVSSWLTEHVTPAGSAVVVDDTLTIQGAAADAKKTGDEISNLKDDLSNKYVGSRGMYNTSTPPFSNANLNHTPGVYFLSSGVTQTMCSNLPKYNKAALFVVETSIIASGAEAWKQTIIYVDGDCYYRFLYGAPSSPVTMNWIPVHEVRPYKIVDINGSGDYTSLSQACVDASTGDTLVVFPGTYDGTLKLFNKRITIIGTDKETCIVRSTDGGYAYPAMEATTGHFENLTFLSRYISGTSQEIDTNIVGAYAVHCEGANDSGFGVGKSISFDNCRLESDFFPALGCGACKDWSITLNNCEIVSNQPTTRGSYATTGGLGAIYMHDHAGQRGHAEIYIKDCIIRTTILKYSMCIYDLGESSNDVDVQFIRNTIYSAVDGFSNSIYWRGVTTPFTNAFTLSPLSNGNTESELNAS